MHPRTLVRNIPNFAYAMLARHLVSRFTPRQFLWQRPPQANRAEVGFGREAGCEKQEDEQFRGSSHVSISGSRSQSKAEISVLQILFALQREKESARHLYRAVREKDATTRQVFRSCEAISKQNSPGAQEDRSE